MFLSQITCIFFIWASVNSVPKDHPSKIVIICCTCIVVAVFFGRFALTCLFSKCRTLSDNEIGDVSITDESKAENFQKETLVLITSV